MVYSSNRTIPGGHCGDVKAFEWFTALWNLVADAMIVCLPMPVLWGLKMRTSKKIGLSLTFGVGTIICLLTLTRVLIFRYYQLDDFTKQAAVVAFISVLEPILGVIIACLPLLPPVFHRIGDTKLYLVLTRSLCSTGSGLSYNEASGNSGSGQHNTVPHGDMQKQTFQESRGADTGMELSQQDYHNIGYQTNCEVPTRSQPNSQRGCDEVSPPKLLPTKGWDANVPATGIQVTKDFSGNSDLRL
ncbi:MAG: hypothetical protein Q9202_001950 [Teloschistes flavicans]